MLLEGLDNLADLLHGVLGQGLKVCHLFLGLVNLFVNQESLDQLGLDRQHGKDMTQCVVQVLTDTVPFILSQQEIDGRILLL